MRKNYFFKFLLLTFFSLPFVTIKAQTTYGSAATYGLRLVTPTYTGSAINVRRSCDNVTTDIGFTCGALNTTALNRFVMVANPVSTISSTTDAAYSLRRVKCSYAGSAINVRRSCDNATKDIGFTSTGDLDTLSLKTFVVAGTPLNAVSTSAAAAYGLRKLNCSYAGSAIQVTKTVSGTVTTQDIGFTISGDLDTASLKTFAGANTCYVTKWYDQSGNSITATQTVSANQPRIVNAGVIDRQNGMPAVRFLSASNMYLIIPQASLFKLADSYCVGSADVATNASNWWGTYRTGGNLGGSSRALANGNANNISGFSMWRDWGGWAVDTVTVNQVSSTTALATRTNLTSAKLSQVSSFETAPVAAATYGSTGMTFGGDAVSTYAALQGYLSELIFYSSALSQTDKTYMQWSQAQYYSISGLSITTLPANVSSGYITTWYDQSGNAYNLTQATAANQPRIVNAGVVDRANGNVSVYLNGSNNYMSNTTYNMLLNSQTPTWNAVVYPLSGNGSYSAVVSWRDAGAVCSQLEIGPNNNWNICWWSTQTDYPTTNGTSVSPNSYQILTSLVQATASQMYVNGSLSYNNTGQTNTAASAGSPSGNTTTSLILGNDACCPGRYLKAYVNEIVLSSTNMSTIDRQYLEWSQAQYYNISGPTYTTPPTNAPSAYITTWYDQSGNGVNLTQTATAQQPQIVNAGTILTLNSLPTIVGSNASQTGLTGTFAASYSGKPLTGSTVFQPDITSTGNLRVMSVGTGTSTADWSNDSYFDVNERGTNNLVIERNGLFTTVSGITIGAPMALSAVFNGSNNQLFINGTGSATTADTKTFSFTTLRVLNSINPSYTTEAMTGRMSEYVLFQSALSTTRRVIMESNQAAYYGFTVSGTKYTAASGYNLFVTGVGRTSATDSVADSRQSVGMGMIVGTTATDYLKDNGDYITFGTSCLTSTVSLSNLPVAATAGYERWANDWYINKTDVNTNGGTVKIFFDFSDYGVSGVPANASNYQLWGRASTAANFTVVPTTAVAISGDRVVFTLPAANLGTTGYYTIGTVDYQNSPLPIELLSFNAVADGDKVDLAWETVTETNNAYFTIEKSKDGINFSKVIDVPGAGNSTSYRNYAEVDYQPYEGTSYYRLKQTDNNGVFKYFNMVPVNFKARKNILVYPNPIGNTTNLNVQVNGFENQEVTVVLRDVQGREFISKVFLTVEGNEIFVVEETKTLQPGTYIVTASTNDKIYNYKLIVR